MQQFVNHLDYQQYNVTKAAIQKSYLGEKYLSTDICSKIAKFAVGYHINCCFNSDCGGEEVHYNNCLLNKSTNGKCANCNINKCVAIKCIQFIKPEWIYPSAFLSSTLKFFWNNNNNNNSNEVLQEIKVKIDFKAQFISMRRNKNPKIEFDVSMKTISLTNRIKLEKLIIIIGEPSLFENKILHKEEIEMKSLSNNKKLQFKSKLTTNSLKNNFILYGFWDFYVVYGT